MHIMHTIDCQDFLNILPQLLKVLKNSKEQLLGVEKVKDNGRTHDTRILRRIIKIEGLPKRRQLSFLRFLLRTLKIKPQDPTRKTTAPHEEALPYE